MLDRGFVAKHTYYYCGDHIAVAPEYVDDGLARFKYSFQMAAITRSTCSRCGRPTSRN